MWDALPVVSQNSFCCIAHVCTVLYVRFFFLWESKLRAKQNRSKNEKMAERESLRTDDAVQAVT